MQKKPDENIIAAFSLLELAVVITIIALLISAVATGQSLMKSASLNAVLAQRSEFINAINSFQSRFKALPGDMNSATTYITSAADNGDGDGQIVWYYATPSEKREGLLAWNHMALAGIISGVYSGVGGDVGNGAVSNVDSANSVINAPRSAVGGVWVISHSSQNNVNLMPNLGSIVNTGNFLFLGGHSYNNFPSVPLFTPIDAYSMDLKIDDGLPLTGILFGTNSSDSNTWNYAYTCVNNATSPFSYAISGVDGDNIKCSLGFFFQ